MRNCLMCGRRLHERSNEHGPQFIPGRESELGKRGVKMALDRPHRERERASNLGIARPLGCEERNLSLTTAQRIDVIRPARPTVELRLRTGPPFRVTVWRPWWIEPAVLHVDTPSTRPPKALTP